MVNTDCYIIILFDGYVQVQIFYSLIITQHNNFKVGPLIIINVYFHDFSSVSLKGGWEEFSKNSN